MAGLSGANGAMVIRPSTFSAGHFITVSSSAGASAQLAPNFGRVVAGVDLAATPAARAPPPPPRGRASAPVPRDPRLDARKHAAALAALLLCRWPMSFPAHRRVGHAAIFSSASCTRFSPAPANPRDAHRARPRWVASSSRPECARPPGRAGGGASFRHPRAARAPDSQKTLRNLSWHGY